MKIIGIEWLDQQAKEAIVTIKGEEYICQAFCHPCECALGQIISSPLLSLSEGEIVKTENKQFSLRKGQSGFSYSVVAKVINIQTSVVIVGGIIIQLSLPFPKDILEGEFISFTTERLDILT